MKDPAVLFYFQDFLVGTDFMSADEVGKYIRILCHQADKGSLTLSQLKRICEGTVPEAVMEKLKIDDEGKYYQERMRTEREKRINYSESRRKNRAVKDDNICETYDKHMENINENKDIVFSIFYDAEILKTKNETYHSFIKFLFGDNDLGRPLKKLLKMNDQISFENFEKLIILSQEHNKKIKDICMGIENHNKTYKSFYLTIRNWLKNKF
jgi:hypothetical protein